MEWNDLFWNFREATSAPKSAIPSAEELLKHCKWDAGGLRAGHVYALLISAAMAAGSLSMVSSFSHLSLD